MGWGNIFSSPPKKRNGKRKCQTPAYTTFDHEAKKRKLQEKLKSFVEGNSAALNPSLPAEESEVKRQEHIPAFTAEEPEVKRQEHIPAFTDILKGNQPVNNSDYPQLSTGDTGSTPVENKKRRTVPNQSAHNLHVKWTQLIPSLIDDFLEYSKLAIAKKKASPLLNWNVGALTHIHANKNLAK